MRERQRAYGVVPIRIAHPQPEQRMPTLLERGDAIRVVRELADEQDAQSVRRTLRRHTFTIRAVLRDFVDRVARRRMEPQR